MADAAVGLRTVLAGRRVRRPRRRRSSPTPMRAILTTGEQARAELVEHLTAGVDWVARRRGDDRRRRRRRSSRSARAASSPASSSGSPPTPRRSPSTTRRRRRSAWSYPSRPPRPPEPEPPKELTERAQTRLQPPRRRHRPRRRSARSATTRQTAWGNLVHGRSRPRRDHEVRRHPATSTRRPARSATSTPPTGWTPRPSGAARASMHFGVAAAKQARRRFGLRDHRREPRGGRRRVRLGAGGQQLMIDDLDRRSTRSGPRAVAPTFIANALVDSHVGDDRDRDRRDRPQRLHRVGLRDRHPQRRRGRRGDPPRRLHRGHLRLDRGAAARGRPTPASRNMRGLGMPAPGRAARRRSRGRSTRPATGSSSARARASLFLEDLELAKARGAKIYAEVVGYGSAADGWDMIQPIERRRRLGPGDEDGPRPARRAGRRGRPDQSPRHLDAARRQARGRGDLDGLRRSRRRRAPSLAISGDEVDDRPHDGRRRRVRGVRDRDVRRRAVRPADDQLPRLRPRVRPVGRRPRPRRCRSATRCRTTSASAATTARSSSSATTATDGDAAERRRCSLQSRRSS